MYTMSYFRWGGLLVLVSVLLVGCSRSGQSVAQFNDTNMKRLVNCYSMYQYDHDFKGPKSEEDFKDFLKNDIGAKIKLVRMGIDRSEIDDIFISERDGEPFKVRYGLRGADVDHAIAFEAVGVNGVRLVGLNPAVECDEELYEEYWSGAKVKEEVESADEQ